MGRYWNAIVLKLFLIIKYAGEKWKISMPWDMMTGLSTKLVWRVHGEQPGVPSECLIYSYRIPKWMCIWWWNISLRWIILLQIWENWLMHWLKAPILTRKNVAAQKIPEKEKYHTYWRLNLIMLLTTMKENGCT